MKEVAAYLLLVLGGNATPSAEDVTGVIAACGGEADEARIAALVEGTNKLLFIESHATF
jgi:large subunit ribosomal protein LP2